MTAKDWSNEHMTEDNQPVSAAAVEPAEHATDDADALRRVYEAARAYLRYEAEPDRQLQARMELDDAIECVKEGDGGYEYGTASATPEAVIARPLHTSGVVDHKTQSIINNEVCPNCVSPWKCNGPHIGERPESGYEDAASTAASAGEAVTAEMIHAACTQMCEAGVFATYSGKELTWMKGCLEAALRASPAAPVIAPGEPVIFVDSHGLHTVLHAGASEVRAYKPSSALIMSMPLTPLYLSPPAATGSDGQDAMVAVGFVCGDGSARFYEGMPPTTELFAKAAAMAQLTARAGEGAK